MTKLKLPTSEELRTRILNVLPAATYQMDRFLEIVDIVVSDRSETACVELGAQPRIHLNAKWVKRYCRRDEHLLMLVLHELHHVILGHTRVFSRLTRAHNIAFDAIINAMLCHQFPEPIYLDFFESMNSASRFPSCLLRPPDGWPNAPKFSEAVTKAQRKILEMLYLQAPDTVTYQEILALLGGSGCSEKEFGKCVLLGDHEDEGNTGSSDEQAISDPILGEVLREMVAGWPRAAKAGLERGTGQKPEKFFILKTRSPKVQFLQALRDLLCKAAVLHGNHYFQFSWQPIAEPAQARQLSPDCHDRLAPAWEETLGMPPLSYATEILRTLPRWQPSRTAHIYADISGSMAKALPWLAGALAPLERNGLCRLFVFSTTVDKVERGCLLKSPVQNTFGTDINCVYRHVAEMHRSQTPARVVVLTDGYTGTPDQELISTWNKRGVRLYVGLVGQGRDLNGCGNVTQLPSPK